MTGIGRGEFITGGGGFLIGVGGCGALIFGGGIRVRVVLAEGNALVTVEGDGELSGTLRVAKVRTTWILPVGPSLSCLTGALTGTSVAAGRLDAAESGVKKRTVCVGSYE